MTLVCKSSQLATDKAYNIQQCQGLLIADELQRLSENFPKINDIAYAATPHNEGINFIVSREYMDLTLAEAFKTKTISYHDKITIFYKICQLVSELQDAGVVHTNLNPNHILLSDDLQRVKLCGFSHAITVAEMTNYKRRQLWRDTFKFFKPDEIAFRPIEISVHLLSDYKLPTVSSAQDVWSLGCIFAYILNGGTSIFGNVTQDAAYVYHRVFTVLGQPTMSEAYEGLKIRYYQTANTNNSHTAERLQQLIQPPEVAAKWGPLLCQMLQYNPERRIGVKQILGIELFKKQWRMLGATPFYVFPKRTKAIQIHLFEDLGLNEKSPTDIRGYFKALFGVRRMLYEEKRKDLVVLACNLGNKTPVPAEIWITIFMYADTKPLMSMVRSK